MPVFRLHWLSRLLRTPGADWVMGIVGIVGIVTWFEMLNNLHADHEFELSRPDAGIAFMMIYFGLAGFLGVRSWRRLWRAGRTRLERTVYDDGVRGFGAFMMMLSPFIVLLVLLTNGMSQDRPSFLLALGFSILLGVVVGPLWLWAGFIGGHYMAGYVGISDSEGAFTDLPPAV
jgi:hypothetical protein